jgi:hypothetical protein
MKRRRRSINIYFLLACVLLAGGCAMIKKATAKKKEESTMRLYIEGERADSTTAGTVLVTSNKIPFTVEREPFLTEGDLIKASIVNDPGGESYSIQLVFNDHGALLLDMYTAENKGKHIIVFSQWPKVGYKAPKAKKKKEADSDDTDLVDANSPGAPETAATNRDPRWSGWLAAVLVRQRISNGAFRFTPDASRAEGDRIVRGLRNVIAENKDNDK